MEECRTDFINHIRVCLSLCVCVCVSIFDSHFLTPIYLFRIYTTVENKYSHRTRSIRISESKEIGGGIFIRMESIDRTVSEKSRDGLNSSRFPNSILADLLSFDSNFFFCDLGKFSSFVSRFRFDFLLFVEKLENFLFSKEEEGEYVYTRHESNGHIELESFRPNREVGKTDDNWPDSVHFLAGGSQCPGKFST